MRRRITSSLTLLVCLTSLIGLTGIAALSAPSSASTAAADHAAAKPVTKPSITGVKLLYVADPAHCAGPFGINLAASFASPKGVANGVPWTFTVQVRRGAELLATVPAVGTPYQGAVNPSVACSDMFTAMNKGFLAANSKYRFVIKSATATIDGQPVVVKASTGDTVKLRRSTIAYDVAAKKKSGRKFVVTGRLLAWKKVGKAFGWTPLAGTVRTLDRCSFRRVKASSKGTFRFTQTVPKKQPKLYLDLPPGSPAQPAWAQQYKVKGTGVLKELTGRPVCF